MAIVINGSGTVTGLSVGGLPDGTVDDGTLASSAVTEAKIATDAVTAAKIPDTVEAGFKSGRKNIIINGAMTIAQRGTSFTDPASGAYTLDRWRAGVHTSTAAANYTQEADAPTAAQAGTNFVNCLKHTCTTIDTSTAATVRYYTRYHIEGYDLARAGFGQAGVRYMTLSFWHKHTKTGVNSFSIVSGDNGRHYVGEYTQTTSDTWEKATHTFPVDTTGTWATDNSKAATLFFATHIGSNYQGTANTWGTGQAYGTANQINNYDSTSNSMRFTGVQLEMGSVATDFEHRSYGEELALCQRYFQMIDNPISGQSVHNILCTMYNGDTAYGGVPLKTSLRAAPTNTYSLNALYIAAAARSFTGFATDAYAGNDFITFVISGISGASAGQVGHLYIDYITVDAEL